MNKIISSFAFVYEGTLHIMLTPSGCCYMLVKSSEKRNRSVLKDLSFYKPISNLQYEKNLEACKQMIKGAGGA